MPEKEAVLTPDRFVDDFFRYFRERLPDLKSPLGRIEGADHSPVAIEIGLRFWREIKSTGVEKGS